MAGARGYSPFRRRTVCGPATRSLRIGPTRFTCWSSSGGWDSIQPEERVAEAIGVVDANRDADGRWRLQKVHEGESYFEMEVGEGKPSRWDTLRALRVLDWYEDGR